MRNTLKYEHIYRIFLVHDNKLILTVGNALEHHSDEDKKYFKILDNLLVREMLGLNKFLLIN